MASLESEAFLGLASAAMGYGDRQRSRGNSRRRGVWFPWSWCSACNGAYFYHHEVKSGSTCPRCSARLQPQLQATAAGAAAASPKHQDARTCTSLEQAQLATAREQHAKAVAGGDNALVASLEAIFPVLKPEPAPPPRSALEQLQQASTKAMRAKRKLDNAIDWAAKLRVQLKDAEEAAVKLYVEAQVADEAHAAAREAHARTCALPTQQRLQPASTPTATAFFGCDIQGLEQDEDIKAALAQFQLLQQAVMQQVQAKRAAASTAPIPVFAAFPPGCGPPAAGLPAAPPDTDTPDDHQMGEADSGKRKDVDREEHDEEQRIKHARMQLLEDVKSAGDEQRKQLDATADE